MKKQKAKKTVRGHKVVVKKNALTRVVAPQLAYGIIILWTLVVAVVLLYLSRPI